jgi:hypothetical protein|tara:strand:- start:5672 stop:5866 length:195 start_codon:yes stop_codon:yes gene_type:complete
MKISRKEIDAIMSLAKKIIEHDNNKEKKVLRSMEDGYDIDELSNDKTEEINLRGGRANCEECND